MFEQICPGGSSPGEIQQVCTIRINHECEGKIEKLSQGSQFGITRLAE